jgi:predicted nucleic acid-binding protein
VTVCLDSWAVLRWLQGSEPAASTVDAAISAERPVVSWVTVGEVACVVERAAGPREASRLVRDLRACVRLDLPSDMRVLQAAAIKASHPMADAEAFAVATARAHGCPLLTGDPVVPAIAAETGWDVVDLRG